jgi:hypothetical protein
MFFATAPARLYHTFFLSVNALADAVNVECTEEGVYAQAMDGDFVCVCCARLPRSAFADFHCDEDLVIGMSTTQICAILDDSADDAVTLKKFGARLTFSGTPLSMPRMPDERLKIPPQAEHAASVTLSSKTFRDVIESLTERGARAAKLAFAVRSDRNVFLVNVEDSEECLVHDGEGSSTRCIDVTLEDEFADDGVCVNVDLEHVLRCVAAATDVASDVTIECSPGRPVQISYTTDTLTVVYNVAPLS